MLDAPRHDTFDDALPLDALEHIRPISRPFLGVQYSLDLDDHALDGPAKTLGVIHIGADYNLERFIIHGT